MLDSYKYVYVWQKERMGGSLFTVISSLLLLGFVFEWMTGCSQTPCVNGLLGDWGGEVLPYFAVATFCVENLKVIFENHCSDVDFYSLA